MERIAFQLRIRADKVQEYDLIHRQVWPEMIRTLEEAGAQDYSIFRRGQDLFLTMKTPSWDETQRKLALSEVNQRWQKMMMPFWEPVPGKRDDEPLAMMQEVFYMPGKVGG
jgi:L-rhamnose mutarotase